MLRSQLEPYVVAMDSQLASDFQLRYNQRNGICYQKACQDCIAKGVTGCKTAFSSTQTEWFEVPLLVITGSTQYENDGFTAIQPVVNANHVKEYVDNCYAVLQILNHCPVLLSSD
jgi:hypothetical protein